MFKVQKTPEIPIRGIDLAHRLLFEVEKHILRVRFLEGLSRGSGKRSFFFILPKSAVSPRMDKTTYHSPEVKKRLFNCDIILLLPSPAFSRCHPLFSIITYGEMQVIIPGHN
jgi:hypothetical protein